MNSLLRGFFRLLLLPLIRTIYRIRVSDATNLPAHGGVLLIANHVSYIDSFIIYAASPRPVRFVIVDHYMGSKPVAWFLRLFNAIPIDKDKPKEAIKITAQAVKDGDVVCIFPEGQLTRTGVMNKLHRGFQLIARQADHPVMPVYMDGLWGSIFSFEGGKFIKKWPRRLPYPVSVAFGEPQAPKEATPDWAFEALLDASVVAFEARQKFQYKEPLEIAFIRALKKRPWQIMYSEHGKSTREMRRSQVLATAIALARRWTKVPLDDEVDRIAVLLPAGPAPAMINLALLLAGKTPVNVPFEVIDDDLAVAGFSKTLNELGVRTIITSKLFVPRLVDVWEADEGRFIDMMRELQAAGAVRILCERIRAYIEPTFVTRWRLGLDESARNATTDEAVGLVPDVNRPAIFLTGAEVQKNAAQTMSTNFIRPNDRILSELALNTPEGTHLSLWAPLLSGNGCIINRSLAKKLDPSLMEAVAIEAKATLIAINKDGVDQLTNLEENWGGSAAVFVRNFLVFGREITAGSVEKIEEITGLPACRGWASKIIGQIVSLSFPDPDDVPNDTPGPVEKQHGCNPASVGRLLPGFSARIERDYANLFKIGELSVRAPVSIARKVLEARKKRGETSAILPEQTGLPVVQANPVDSLLQPCWIVGADKARFDEHGLLFLDEEVE